MHIKIAILVGLSLLLWACNGAPAEPVTQAISIAPSQTLPPPQVRVTPALASPASTDKADSAEEPGYHPSVAWTATPAPSLPPTVSTTPDAYAGLAIDDLSGRSYGGGEILAVETLAVNSYFTRTLITYPSDGLTIYGFLNTPRRGTPPYPMVIAIHGYIDPQVYDTLDYTTRYADALARAGFMVLHPNLRGYPPSMDGDNRFRVGMAVDVLNLVALVKELGGKPGLLAAVDPQRIGLWGHSMGGGIAIRVLTISPDIKAAVLYGSMSADDRLNYERIFSYFSNGQRGQEELSAPAEVFARISPVEYLDRIRAAVSIHHGEQDIDVPPTWSADLCQRLRSMQKYVECYTYPGQAHTFQGDGDQLFIQRSTNFFMRWLGVQE